MRLLLTGEEIRRLRAEWSDGWRGGQGTTLPHIEREDVMRLLDEVERIRALLRRLERSPREASGSYGWLECPDCRRATMSREPINHAPGCELFALLKSGQ